MRRWVSVSTPLLICLGLAACGSSSPSASSGQANPLTVRVITASPVTSGVWDPLQFKAYSADAASGGWKLQEAQAIPYGSAAQVFDSWGSAGVDVVFSTDNGFQQSFLAAAAKYPKTAWVMMSSLSTANGLNNVSAYSINWCDLGFVQGVAAALISKSHRIANIEGLSILPEQQAMVGEQFGASLAVPGTKVDLRFTQDFLNVATAQRTTAAAIAAGDDVVNATTQGFLSPVIAAEAQKDGAYYVGTYVDQTAAAPNATVTSALVDLGNYYTQAVDSWKSGSFKSGVHVTGLAQGVIKLAPFNLGFQNLTSTAQGFITQLVNGQVKYPAGGVCAGQT